LLYGGNITKIRDDSINLSTDIRLVNKQKMYGWQEGKKKKKKSNKIFKNDQNHGRDWKN